MSTITKVSMRENSPSTQKKNFPERDYVHDNSEKRKKNNNIDLRDFRPGGRFGYNEFVERPSLLD